MTFQDFSAANLKTVLDGPLGETLAYRPGGEVAAEKSIRASVTRTSRDDEFLDGLIEERIEVVILQDATNGIASPAVGDTFDADDNPGGTSVSYRVTRVALGSLDGGWRLFAKRMP